MKNIKIVVSRFNENITWVKNFNQNNVIIYNKGQNDINLDYNIIKLQNVGREGHTYYKFISDNYDNLPDFVIFLQGFPFDHSPNIINVINDILNNNDELDDFTYLSTCMVNFTFEKGCGYLSIQHLNDTYEKIFNKKNTSNQIYTFGTGAQFMVSKKAILQKPKEFYEGIVKMLEYSINPIEGYGLERLHKIIFS